MQDQRFEIMEMPNAWQGRSLTCLSVRGPLSQSNGNAMSTLRARARRGGGGGAHEGREACQKKVGEETDDGGRAPARYFLLP